VSPLYFAVRKDNMEMVKYLIENKADINIQANVSSRRLVDMFLCLNHDTYKISTVILK
jgi:ankyrin repeat protein